MKVTISREEVADAILYNNEIGTSNGNEMAVFVYPAGRTETHVVGVGTYYTGVDYYDPRAFIEEDLEDTYQWRHEARDERVKEGKVPPQDEWDDLTDEEEDLIQEYVDLYESVWRENLKYLKVVGDLEIEWTD